MPHASFRVRTTIHAAPDLIFATLADLPGHSRWAANPLRIEPISPGPVAVGQRYRSTAQVSGITFTAELQVTTYQPPHVFAFTGEDSTGHFAHQFTLQPIAQGAQLQRHIRFALTFRQWLLFLVLFYPVRLPAANKALALLKQHIEQQET
jgi:uncharacterized protein YndB with AHSA1/START domain